MSSTTATSTRATSADPVEQRSFSVTEYHRMIEAGILNEDEHVELQEGTLIIMTPQGRPHARVIQRLNRIFARSLSERYEVLPQLPLTIGESSELEPDLAVVLAEEAKSAERHPHTALLVVEVSADSLARDRTVKAALYARSGIAEYWIVNLNECVFEIYREPDRSREQYRSSSIQGIGEIVAPSSFQGPSINVAEIFGD